jgi:hypothetical protein
MERLEEILKEIRDLTLPKENFSIIFSSDKTDYTTNFSPMLYLNPKKRFELALVNLETYNSIPNVDGTNNTFVYSSDNGTTWKTIRIPEGCYEIPQINAAIQRQLEVNGHWNSTAVPKSHYITVGANSSTLRAYVEITNTIYRVNFAQSTIRSMLGFNPKTLRSGYHEGDNPVDILKVNTILVNCDIISGSYRNGSQTPVVYSFFPDVSPGYKIVESPNNLVYLPVAPAGDVQRMRVWLTDQDGQQLNLRGETITIRFHIRGV